MEDFQQLILNPDTKSKGATRWWWYGCAVDKTEIVRELDFMLEANIGGVELQILYPVKPDGEVKNIEYLSPAFLEMLKFTAAECEKRGMWFDFTPGSSWPFGGPGVSPEDAMQQVVPYTIDIEGPTNFQFDFTTRFAGQVVAATLGKIEKSQMLPETVLDITSKVVTKYLFGWPWGEELLPIEIPEGSWKLVFFVVQLHQNHVGKPSRNAEGLVIDHCSAAALNNFWADMVKPITDLVPCNSLFCDSIEVEGHNWSPLLLNEFKKRRGYDLTPWIYALWGDMGEDTKAIRYDYFLTMSELTLENFFTRFTELCHESKVSSRIQAHGTWGDILEAYGVADIPEGETFGDQRKLKVNTIHRRLAVSAAYLYHRPIVSNETFTWLVKPRFTEKLVNLKAAVDAVFADGINAIVNHGYAYSAPEDGAMGLPFYASCHLNHNQPWWPLYKHLGKYIQRVSEFLRRGELYCEVGIYLPQSDIWSDNPLSDLHMAMKLEEHLDTEAVDRIQKAGYWFTYINDKKLQTEIPYKVILLIGCKRLPVASAEALARFVEAGGILIAAEDFPRQSTGYLDRIENQEKVSAIMKSLFESGRAKLTSNRHEELINTLNQVWQPDVKISHSEEVGYVHRRDKNHDYYFFTNISEHEVTSTILFKSQTTTPRIFCAESGQEIVAPNLECQEKGGKIRLTFPPYRSLFLVFSAAGNQSEQSTNSSENTKKADTVIKNLTHWQLKLGKQDYTLSSLEGWQKLDPYFSGCGIYETEIELDTISGKMLLDLGQVESALRVYVNGEFCADLWLPPFRLDISAKLKMGRNQIRLEVFGTMINGALNPLAEPQKLDNQLSNWPYVGNRLNLLREDKLTFEPERKALKAQEQVNGLLGPVHLLVTD